MAADPYTRAFTNYRIVDGDTLANVDVDLGYHIAARGIEFRVARINCPERHKPTLDAGNAAMGFTEDWLFLHARHGGLYATTEKTDSFGRYLAEITCADGHNLSDDLLASGNAVLYKAK